MQQQQGTTIAQKIEIGAGLAITFAFPVMVLLRRKMGYRLISPVRLIITGLVFWVVAVSASVTASPGTSQTFGSPATPAVPSSNSYSNNAWLILAFTAAFVIWGYAQRWLRWRDIKRGVPWHSRSRGISWFQKILPLSDSNIKRFVDPAFVLAVGLVLLLTSFQSLLGGYLIFAAACLFAWEAYDYDRSINLMLDQLDALIDSEVISENVEYYQQPNPKQRALDETAGIPTGVAPDLQAALERRRSRDALSPSAAAALTAQTVFPPAPAAVVAAPQAPTGGAGPAPDNLVLPDDTAGAP